MSSLICAVFYLGLWMKSTSAYVPFTISSIQPLGIVTDPISNNEGIFHDGGGGASQNGYHVQVFADSMTVSEGINMVHNSVTYYGFASRSVQIIWCHITNCFIARP